MKWEPRLVHGGPRVGLSAVLRWHWVARLADPTRPGRLRPAEHPHLLRGPLSHRESTKRSLVRRQSPIDSEAKLSRDRLEDNVLIRLEGP